MAKDTVVLGPFSGGLNTLADPASIEDTELVDVVNFEFDTDGSLTSRYPIVKLPTPTGLAGTDLKLLGYFITTDNIRYIIASTTTGTYWSLNGVAWAAITTSFGATAAIQYQGFMWLLAAAGSVGASGKWSPSQSFATVANMPQGDAIAQFKNRLFIVPGKLSPANGSRLTFSDFTSTAALTFSATGFIDINPGGDGQNIVDLIVENSNIILFKQDSTYVYTYSSSPSTGSISMINGFIGSSAANCVVQTSGGIFVYHKGVVYGLQQLNYVPISDKVPFAFSPGAYADYNAVTNLGYFDDRLLVRHFDKIYVFYLKTSTWSRWETVFNPSHFMPVPSVIMSTQNQFAYTTSVKAGVNEMYQIQNSYTTDVKEPMTCRFRTKIYNYQSPHTFKRIMWWGVDVVAKGAVSVVEFPVITRKVILWDDLENITYDSWASWDFPTYSLPQVTDNAIAGDAPQRKFIRFIKSLRFRQIYFTVAVETDGSVDVLTLDGIPVEPYPCKVFSISTVVANKQLVPAKVN